MRNQYRRYNLTPQLLTLFLALTFTLGKADQIVNVSQRVDEMIAAMPAQTHTQQDFLTQELLDLGPSGTAHLLRRLGDLSDDDNQARLLVSALAKFLGKGDREDAALAVEERFTEYLVSEKPPRAAQTFVLNQLQFFVSAASIDPLGGLITDVCFPIVRILTSIGTPEALEVMLAHSDEVPGDCNAAILQACAQLEGDCRSLAEKYKGDGASEVADAAHRALLVNTRSDGMKIGKNSMDVDAIHQVLDHWEASAEQGNVTPLEDGVARLLRDTKDQMIAVRAVGLAKHYLKDKVIAMVSKALRNVDGSTGAEIIGLFHGSEVSVMPLYKMADDLELPAQVALASLIAERGDKEGLKLARNLLSEKDDDAKIAGVRALSGIQSDAALPELISFLKQAKNTSTASAAAAESSQYISKQNKGILKEALHQSGAFGQIATVELIGNRGLGSLFGDVITLANSSSDQVREAVFAALPSIASGENYAELMALQPFATSDLSTQHLSRALIKHYDASGDQRDLLKESFEDPKQQKLVGSAMSGIGDQYLLDFVYKKMLETGGYPNPAQDVLLQWSKPNGLKHLKSLLTHKDSKVKSAAIDRMIRLAGSLNETQRLLQIRDLMGRDINPADQERALSSLNRIPSIPVFNYLKSFLDQSPLKTAAAKNLVRVGLALIDDHLPLGMEDLKTLNQAVIILADQASAEDAARIRVASRRDDLGPGFKSLFNGKDLTGWQGLVGNPISRSKMSLDERRSAQLEADSIMHTSWFVEDGILRFDGDGYNNLTTQIESYDNFELIMDWKIEKDGDSGIYLKGTPQVQIWDPASEGNKVGSGGLFNNQVHAKEPNKVADNPIGEWNTFRIRMINDRVTVHLNGELVTDNVVLENYWDRESILFARGPIELQAHTTPLYFRDIYLRPIEGVSSLPPTELQDGFVSLFNGVNLDGWIGNKTDYIVEDGEIRIYPTISGGSGNLFTAKEYDNFTLRFEFKLTPGANNGLGIHAPLDGDAAYLGKELQILDNTAEIYSKLKEYQYHGSAYGVAAAKRGFLRPVGEWNEQEVQVQGNNFKVTLNGEVILDADLDAVSQDGTIDGRDHPGLKKTKGYIGFLGHGSEVHFRNLRIKEM